MELHLQVTAKKGKPFTILQLTDPQMIDPTQCRYPERLSDVSKEAWDPKNFEVCCFAPIRRTVEAAKPDLIVVTGDLVYGEIDDSGRALGQLIDVIDSFGIPWAPVWGNHDNESLIGVKAQCDMVTRAKHSLFERGTTDGNSNYVIGIYDEAEGGERTLSRVLYMMDSNTCHGSQDSEVLHVTGFTERQKEWLSAQATAISADGIVPGFACFHMPTADCVRAMVDAGYQPEGDENAGNYIIRGTAPASQHYRDLLTPGAFEDSDPETVLEPADPGDSGYKYELRTIGGFIPPLSALFKASHIDGVFTGHCHTLQLSVRGRDGIRYTNGVKSSVFDYHTRGRIGGTMITLSPDRRDFAVTQLYV